MIKADDIRERLAKTPFSPFRIRMSSGDAYDIYHPELVVAMNRLLMVGTVAPNGDPEDERAHVLSVMHVTALESIPPRSKRKQSA
jgi:hypothetical protein